MPDSLALIILVAFGLHCAVSAVAGYAVARRRGRSILPAVAICAVLPWLGVCGLAALASGTLPTDRSPRNLLRTAGVVALALGGVLVVFSLADDWATASGNADRYKEAVGGGPSDSGVGVVVVALLGLVLVAFAIAAWRHGGLRFAIPVAWVSTTAASVLVSAILVTDVLNDMVGGVATFAAGQAHASLEVGGGAWSALAGAALAVLASVALMLSAAIPAGPASPVLATVSAFSTVVDTTSDDPWNGLDSAPADPWQGAHSPNGNPPPGASGGAPGETTPGTTDAGGFRAAGFNTEDW